MISFIRIKLISLFLLILLSGMCLKLNAQVVQYYINIDSLQSDVPVGEDFNLAISIIKGWQKISFRTPLLNCQLEPCCSNYAIHSISHKGFLKGMLYTADRISRCHSLAFLYYPEKNGRLIDDVSDKSYFESEHIPYISIPVSFVIPGFNKMINGRLFDGLNIFFITGFSAYGAYMNYKNDNLLYIPLTFSFLSFYMSDIYFNFLSLN